MDSGETHANGPKHKKHNDHAQSLIANRWHRQSICGKKKKENEDAPALKIA